MANYNKRTDGSLNPSAAKAAQKKSAQAAAKRRKNKKRQAAINKAVRQTRRAFEGAGEFFSNAANKFRDWYKQNDWWIDPALYSATKLIPGVADDGAAAALYADDVTDLLLGNGQHPQWYMNLDPKSMPIGVNYVADKTTPIGTDNSSDTTVDERPYYRPEMVVNYIMNGFGANTDPQLLFTSELQKIVDLLNAASGRNANYDRETVREYIFNVTTLTIMVAHAIHLYECLYHVDSEDSGIHDALRYAFGVTSSENLADYRDRLREIIISIYDIFPLFGDIIERKVWLFSNTFAESGTQKPALCINRPYHLVLIGDDGIMWSANTNFFYGEGADLNTLAEIIDDLNSAVDAFQQWVYDTDNELRADLMRIVGMDLSITLEKQFLSQLEPDIPGLRVISDQYYMDQIMNANYISLLRFNTEEGMHTIFNADYRVDADGAMYIQESPEFSALQQTEIFYDIFSNHFVNCPLDAVDNMGKQLSITRLQPVFRKRDGENVLELAHAGTEILQRRRVITYADLIIDGDLQPLVIGYDCAAVHEPIDIDGAGISFRQYAAERDLTNAPISLMLVPYNGDQGPAIQPQVFWDFKQYGTLPNTSSARMHAIANTSLIHPIVKYKTRGAFIEDFS